jgi:hypothetical protein
MTFNMPLAVLRGIAPNSVSAGRFLRKNDFVQLGRSAARFLIPPKTDGMSDEMEGIHAEFNQLGDLTDCG